MFVLRKKQKGGISGNQRGLKAAISQMDGALFLPLISSLLVKSVCFQKRDADKDSSGDIFFANTNAHLFLFLFTFNPNEEKKEYRIKYKPFRNK